MTNVYGGLFLENLFAQDEYYSLQMELFKEGLIQGIQLRVAHPLFTSKLTDPSQLPELPDGFSVFIHLGSENVGVDLGRNFDEKGVFSKMKDWRTWEEWNRESIEWGLLVAEHFGSRAVIHPGYAGHWKDIDSFERAIALLLDCSLEETVLLENVPPFTINNFWGIGGTPSDMGYFLQQLGSQWQCLIDLTHIYVAFNQAKEHVELLGWQTIQEILEGYLSLPHSKICHFSGLPPTSYDSHGHLYLKNEFSSFFGNCMTKDFDIVCLEIPFDPRDPDTTRFKVNYFRKFYLGLS